jgi:hypothetical protein
MSQRRAAFDMQPKIPWKNQPQKKCARGVARSRSTLFRAAPRANIGGSSGRVCDGGKGGHQLPAAAPVNPRKLPARSSLIADRRPAALSPWPCRSPHRLHSPLPSQPCPRHRPQPSRRKCRRRLPCRRPILPWMPRKPPHSRRMISRLQRKCCRELFLSNASVWIRQLPAQGGQAWSTRNCRYRFRAQADRVR